MRFIKLKDALIDPEMVESLYLDRSVTGDPFTVVHMVSGHRFWLDKTMEEVVDILYPPVESTEYVAPESDLLVVAPYVQSVVKCPRCGCIPGYLCRTPSGNLATYPHQERQEAYSEYARSLR